MDGAIHRVAGGQLAAECAKLGGCDVGDAKITKGYHLPARHVIHTVGPVGERPEKLTSCYQRCLEVLVVNGLRSICFCSISTGAYKYPLDKAAQVALTSVRDWLRMDQNSEGVDHIVFCTHTPQEREVYSRLMQDIFSGVPFPDDSTRDEAPSPSNRKSPPRHVPFCFASK